MVRKRTLTCSRFFALGAIAGNLLACNAASRTGDVLTVADSAGIQVFEIAIDPWTASDTWEISPAPLLQIGVPTGDSAQELFQINGARRLSNGSVAVSSSATNDIRVFTAEGEYSHAIGRAGRGPGEFAVLGGIETLAADTLIAIDFGRPGLVAVTPDGRFHWSRSFETGSCAWIAEEWPARFRLSNGGFLIVCEEDDVWSRIRSGSVRAGSLDRSTAIVVSFAPTGAVPDTVLALPGIEYGIIDMGSGPSTIYPPYGRRLAYSVTGDGLFIGTQEDFEIRRYSAQGTLVAILRGPRQDLTTKTSDLDRLRPALLANARGDRAEAERFVNEYLSEYPRPETRPAYGRILYDAAGRLWISEAYHQFETPTRWAVILFSDLTVANVTLPDRFEMYEVGEDYVLGRWRDDAGVEYVQLLRLARSVR